MTTIGPSGRITKRRSRPATREVNRAKVALDVDLNSLHFDTSEAEDYCATVNPRLTQRRSLSTSSHRIRATQQQQGSVPPPCDDLNAPVIDLEAFDDDDVQMLSSSRGFPPARNCSRRNRPVTVILDDDQESNSRRSEESLLRKATVINCEQYPYLKEGHNAKGKNVVESKPESGEEPTFTCPVCMNTLVEASSTICGHIFCKECIKASIKAQKKCPTCRKKLNMNNFHRVYFPTAA